MVTARTKKALLARFAQRGKRKMFAIKTFAALTFLALKPLLKYESEVVIDLEYPGHEPLIKDQLLFLTRKAGLSLGRNSIVFTAIGKRSAAHQLALGLFRRRTGVRRVTSAELARLLSL